LEVGIGGPVIEDGDAFVASAAVFAAADDRKGGLAAVVGMKEVVGGSGAVPGTADSATAEEVLGRQAHEDLPYHNLIREATEERRRYGCTRCIRHGHRLGSRFRPEAKQEWWSCDGEYRRRRRR
jgi:hypothetical protein